MERLSGQTTRSCHGYDYERFSEVGDMKDQFKRKVEVNRLNLNVWHNDAIIQVLFTCFG